MKAVSKLTFSVHIRKLRVVLEKHEASPAAFVGTVLNAWCTQEYGGLTPANLPVKSQLLGDEHVKTFMSFLRGHSFLDAAYWLSSAYAMLRGDCYRKLLAMFFTPPSLTERLLSDLEMRGVRYDKGRFFDPACGGAAFLAPIALRMKALLKAKGMSSQMILEHVEANLFGTDLDDTLCALSHQFLKMALSEEIRNAQMEPVFRITTCNSLCDVESHFGTIDVVVCNPPYRKTTAEETEKYRNNFSEVIETQPNMYGLFIALSVKLLKQEGVCALVTPTSFLSGQYFSKLRELLMKEVQVLSIGMVSDRSGVFIDVEQETALTLLRRTSSSFSSKMQASVSVVSRDGKYVDVGLCVLPNSGAAWPIPRAENDVLLLEKAALSKFRIKDYGYAIRIGTFVWNRDKRPVYLSAAAANNKTKTAVPLLWSSDIKKDGTLFFDGLVKANEEPCFVDFGDKAHRSIIRRASILLQRVTSNGQPRRLVAAAVPQHILDSYGGYVGENHTVILEQVDDSPKLAPSQMAELLSSVVVDRYFRCISGATNVSAFELKQLSLPDPELLNRILTCGSTVEDAARIAVFGQSAKSVKPQISLSIQP